MSANHLSNAGCMSARRLGLLVGLALAAHVCATWFNVGYLHPDEHFQILEFAGHRLGHSPAVDLPWEFEVRIRPSLQPVMAMAVVQVLDALGLSSPFFASFVLRLASSMTGLLLSLGIAFYALRWIRDARLKSWVLYLTCLFWAMPLLHSRFSSENMSALFFFGGLLCLLAAVDRLQQARRGQILAGCAGLAFGLAFFCRFQIGLSVAGVLLWLLLVARPPRRWIVALAVGLLLGLGLGVVLDRWFYGEWVLSPWRYLVVNLVENRAADFGVMAWWWYFLQLFYQCVPPFSLVILAGGLIAVVRRPRHVLVWVLVPFLLTHILIGHKEPRFLYPMIYLLPVLTVLGIDALAPRARERFLAFAHSSPGHTLGMLWVGVNTMIMFTVVLLPAHRTAVIQQWLHRRGEQGPVTVYTLGRDPYVGGAGHRMNFYASPAVQVRALKDVDELRSLCADPTATHYLFYEGFDVPAACRDGGTLRTEVSSLPRWMVNLPVVRRLFLIHLWGIYTCSCDAAARSAALFEAAAAIEPFRG